LPNSSRTSLTRATSARSRSRSLASSATVRKSNWYGAHHKTGAKPLSTTADPNTGPGLPPRLTHPAPLCQGSGDDQATDLPPFCDGLHSGLRCADAIDPLHGDSDRPIRQRTDALLAVQRPRLAVVRRRAPPSRRVPRIPWRTSSSS
jgi:hypothetical protein